MIQYDAYGRRVIINGTDDPRYMVRLVLIREQRPKYWNFHCIYCGQKVCELNGSVAYMTDISNEGLATDDKSAVQMRCNSRQCGGRAWFQFDF